MLLKFWVPVLLLVLAGCVTPDAPGSEAPPTDSTATEESDDAYRVVLSGALADTLTGNARFGLVVDPTTRKELLVVELESETDFTGGVFITRGDTLWPQPGSYDLAAREKEDAAARDARFRIVYRQDLQRRLEAVSGTLTFSHVSDTLIAGSFQSNMRGRILLGGGQEERELGVQGRFEARPGPVGYIIGL